MGFKLVPKFTVQIKIAKVNSRRVRSKNATPGHHDCTVRLNAETLTKVMSHLMMTGVSDVHVNAKYEISFAEADFLGNGTFGYVYKGRRIDTADIVAVKRIPLLNNVQQEKYLDQELTALSRIKHPNVVKLYDVNRSTHFLYLYMEYCEHGDLHNYLRTTSDFPTDVMLSFIQQSAEAVLYMHTMRPQPFVHRDLKPGNLLVHIDNSSDSRKPVLKVADLGLAKAATGSAGLMSTFCGTPDFMAPEVRPDADGTMHYDSKADVFSLGVIYHTLLTFIWGHALSPVKVDGLPVGEWMWSMKLQNKHVWPPVTFSVTDAPHVTALKVLIHQMIQQEAAHRLDMTTVCEEIIKINDNLGIENIQREEHPVSEHCFDVRVKATRRLDIQGEVTTGYGDCNYIILCVNDSMLLFRLTETDIEEVWQKTIPRGQSSSAQINISKNHHIYMQSDSQDIHKYTIDLQHISRLTANGKMLTGKTEGGMIFASWPADAEGSYSQKLTYEAMNRSLIHTFSDTKYLATEYIWPAHDKTTHRTVIAGKNDKFIEIFDAEGVLLRHEQVPFHPYRPSCTPHNIFIPAKTPARLDVYSWEGVWVCTLDHHLLAIPENSFVERITPMYNNSTMLLVKEASGDYFLQGYHIEDSPITTHLSSAIYSASAN